MTNWPPSVQLIGSRTLGGAERWFQRFAVALAAQSAPVTLGIRAHSALTALDYANLPTQQLPFWTVWDPYSRHAVRQLLRQVQPAIVQTYMGRATRLTQVATLQSRPRHIARLGGYYALAPYRHADAWIGNTRGLCDWLVAQGLPAQRVYHIYNFIEPPRWHPPADIAALRATLSVHPEAWLLLALGRLVPVKGQRDLLAAAAQLPCTIADRPWQLLIVGDGPLQLPLQQYARQLGIDARVTWCGWQTVPSRWLQLADVVIFPSLEAETLGNVILEAWAWQRPLVTTQFRGARELVRHGDDAWAVPCGDTAALASGIEQVLRDEALRAALVTRGQQRVMQTFSPAHITAQYQACYAQVLQ